MVSLEERSTYRDKLVRKPIVNAFVEFLEGKEITSASFSPLDEVLFKLMVAFQTEEKSSFESEYSELSRRVPSSSAPYIYNDFLAFVLICGTSKFKLNQDWITKILDARNCSDDDCKLTTLAFRNLLNANYNSKNNHFPTILVFQKLCEIPLLGNEELNNTYKEIVQNLFPRFNSDFLNLLILRAFDIIILRKDVLEKGELNKLKSFENRFNSRAKLIGNIFHYVSVFVIYAYITHSYFSNMSFQNLIKPHLGFFSAIGGGGLFVMFFFSKRIARFYEKLIKKFWGVKKDEL